MPGPLDGVRILDLTQVIAGPLGCMLLADLGAEVVKVEPLGGEPWRLTGMFMPHESKAYQSLNRGKDSVALDLQRRESIEVIRKLVRTCDVVVINYRPDVAKRLGIDYDSLREERPDLIYLDSTAFGRKGPWAHRPGYDIVAQAASGLLMHRNTVDERGFPALSGNAAPGDFTTGYAIAWGVCAALFHRERTGRGQMVETSLLTNALMLQTSSFMSLPAVDGEKREAALADIAQSRAKGEPIAELAARRRGTLATAGGGVYYRGYLTKDGALCVGCLSPGVRDRFRTAIGRPDLPEETMTPAAASEMLRGVEALLQSKTTDEWMALFDTHGVPASPVWFVEELMTNPQVVENGYVVELDHDLTGPQTMPSSPLRMSDSPPEPKRASPPLGRDTRKWLLELGYAEAAVDALIASGAAGEM